MSQKVSERSALPTARRTPFGLGACAAARGAQRRSRAADTTSDITGRGMPLHLTAVSVKSQPVAGRNDSVGFSAGLADFLSDGVTVAQRSLEPLVLVRVQVGQPLQAQRESPLNQSLPVTGGE